MQKKIKISTLGEEIIIGKKGIKNNINKKISGTILKIKYKMIIKKKKNEML
jgi:hypothetical protein